ncbi:hypothetical protein D3C81_911420 [compost metagenome]
MQGLANTGAKAADTNTEIARQDELRISIVPGFGSGGEFEGTAVKQVKTDQVQQAKAAKVQGASGNSLAGEEPCQAPVEAMFHTLQGGQQRFKLAVQ